MLGINNKQSSGRTDRLAGLPAGGFTLVEIMLSLGVLGIGMVLVATLFPPAIMQFRRSDHNTLAIVINENARAVLTARCVATNDAITHSGDYSAAKGYAVYEFVDVPIGDNFHNPLQTDDDMIHQDDALYTLRRGAGWRALVRKMSVQNNLYQFVVVPFVLPPTADIDDSTYASDIHDDNNEDSAEYRFRHIAVDADTSGSGNEGNIDHDVRLLQTLEDGSLMLLEKSDFNDLADLDWLAVGSPVILDGNDPNDESFLGRTAKVLDIRVWEEDNDYWAVELSRGFFDARHTDWSDIINPSTPNPGVPRGVWVFSADTCGAPSPALCSYVFTAVIK